MPSIEPAHDMAALLANGWRLLMSGSFVEVLVATFVGSLVGGAAAFKAERRKREDDKGEERRAAIGRTLFRLYRYRQIVEFINTHEVEPMKASPAGVYASKPWLDTDWHVLPLELGGIEFLFATEHATVLVDLLDCEEEFKSLTAMVRQRSSTMRNVVTPIADRHPAAAADGSPGFDLRAVIAELTPSQLYELQDLATQIAATTSAAREKIPRAMKRLASAQRALWPKHHVQYIDVIEGQRKDGREKGDDTKLRSKQTAPDNATIEIPIRTFRNSNEPFIALLAAKGLAYQVVKPPVNIPLASGLTVVVHGSAANGAALFESLARVLQEFLALGVTRIATVTLWDSTVLRIEGLDDQALARCLASAREVMVADTGKSKEPAA